MDARTTPRFVTVSDRNKACFLLAHHFQIEFVNSPCGRLDFRFPWSPDLDEAIAAYNCNRSVLVQDFLAAQRQISDAIRDRRDRYSRGM